MSNVNRFAEIGSLIGDPARAAMLNALMDGRAFTAGELARCAGVTPQTASAHLAQLSAADLLVVEKQGRHRYHRLAHADVARMLESVMQVASGGSGAAPLMTGPANAAMRRARSCYDHLAGRLGVAIADALIEKGAIEFGDGAGVVTDAGEVFFARLGLDFERAAAPSRRALCRPCLDWSERRPHIAGRLGGALLDHLLNGGHLRRIEGSRALDLTPKGRLFLREALDLRDF